MNLVNCVVSDIVRISNPTLVILYGKKSHVASGDLKSMDFCVVTAQEPKRVLQNLYREIDYDVPVNFKVYAQSDWEKLLGDRESYAYLIHQKGTVLYERQKTE